MSVVYQRSLKLKELYRELSKEPNSPLSFIANVIYCNYNRSRKQKLQGLYNIVNGGPRHYWAPCHVTFAPFSLDIILATNDELIEGHDRRIRGIDIENLAHYA